MKSLTKAEEEIMLHLWDLKETKIAGIVDTMNEPKPAYNTVSTVVRRLENKGFVSHRKKGRGYIYFPVVS